MMKKALFVLAAAASVTALFAADTPKTNLGKLYEKDFLIGVALNQRITSQQDKPRAELAAAQFNCLTPENCMKWDATEPQEGKFNFGPGDDLVKYAQKNKMKIHGHTLIWHSQTPQWVFQGENGQPATRELVLKRMKNHIEGVMKHYKGKVDAWDVVNEAFNEDGTLRNSQWKRIVGDDFIEKAFEFARAADPSAKLVYNDYNADTPSKRDGIAKLAKELKKKGLIDAVGMQGHYLLDYPSSKQIEEAIKKYADAGVKVMVTEMDVDVLPRSNGRVTADISATQEYQEKNNPYTKGLPDEVNKKLADRYEDIFKVFLKHSKDMYSVTIWGLDDGTSWLNGFPVRERTNHPLLFDRQLKAKPCYDALVNLKQPKKK